ncbi:MAG: aldehyde dehydrogenase family protein, partial [Burkholderiales bacterium]|nr:aldehyde dehydrogenase family protein [Burkholderiales bacterium]
MHSPDVFASFQPAFAPYEGTDLPVHSPIDGGLLTTLRTHTKADVAEAIERASVAFGAWRNVPAPKRGELVRRLGQKLREHKERLAWLVTVENGKILEEGRGEVQEMID